MPLLNLFADTAPALLKALREVDIKVPSITKGRSHTHRERYLMARFLATTAESQLIDYPLTVTHRDKPDFVLQLGSNLIGVECVEAVPEEWYEIEAIRGRKYPHAFNFGQKNLNLAKNCSTPSRKTKLQAETVQVCHGWETAQSLNGLKPWRILSG